MDYKSRMDKITPLVEKYNGTKSEEDYDKIVKVLDKYINNTLIRVYGHIEEDVKLEVYSNIHKWVLKNNTGKQIVNNIIYFIRHYKFTNSNIGLSRNEKHEFRKLYLMDTKSETDVKRYNELKSKIVYLDLGIDYETVQDKYCLFESVKELLSEEDYKIIYAYFKENYTATDIGKQLGVSQQAIDKRLKNILKKLKDELVIE